MTTDDTHDTHGADDGALIGLIDRVLAFRASLVEKARAAKREALERVRREAEEVISDLEASREPEIGAAALATARSYLQRAGTFEALLDDFDRAFGTHDLERP